MSAPAHAAKENALTRCPETGRPATRRPATRRPATRRRAARPVCALLVDARRLAMRVHTLHQSSVLSATF